MHILSSILNKIIDLFAATSIETVSTCIYMSQLKCYLNCNGGWAEKKREKKKRKKCVLVSHGMNFVSSCYCNVPSSIDGQSYIGAYH